MGGRRLKLGEGNGFFHWGRGDPDRKIRRVVCQEKPLRRVRYPYHKPTQVDEKNILRRSGDGLFRN